MSYGNLGRALLVGMAMLVGITPVQASMNSPPGELTYMLSGECGDSAFAFSYTEVRGDFLQPHPLRVVFGGMTWGDSEVTISPEVSDRFGAMAWVTRETVLCQGNEPYFIFHYADRTQFHDLVWTTDALRPFDLPLHTVVFRLEDGVLTASETFLES